MLLRLLVALSALVAAPALAAPPPARFLPDDPPRLVVVLVVDQLRADYLGRFRTMLGDDGLGELMTKGAWYPYGEYDVIQAMTGPGHSTVSTGAWPTHNGIVLNYWVDRASGSKVYSLEDPKHRWVGAEETPKHAGTSPRNLRAPTLGDALKNSGQASRVVSIAFKDRAAIALAGYRADDVVWFDYRGFRWVTSDFYRPDGQPLPWMKGVNGALADRKGQAFRWQVKGAPVGPSDEGPKAGFAQDYTLGKDKVAGTPFAPEAVVDAALAAADAHGLGRDAIPDLLFVSFSGFDSAGHGHGPNHRRMESMLAAVDDQVARLIDGLAGKMANGRADLVVTLTGDHGVAPVPEYALKHRMPAGRLDFDAVPATVEAALSKQFGQAPGGGNWVRGFRELNLYLTPNATAEHRAAAAAAVEPMAPVRFALTREAIQGGRLPPAPLDRRVGNQFDPVRSGDVMVVLHPYNIYASAPASHLTGYTYDRLVPLILMGRPFAPGVYGQKAQIIDLAMTLSFVLGIQPPAMAEGRVLHEALKR